MPAVDPKKQALAKKLLTQLQATSKALKGAAATLAADLVKVQTLVNKEAAANKVVERIITDNKLKTKFKPR